jgi:uncharacterized protein (DUF342 family)
MDNRLESNVIKYRNEASQLANTMASQHQSMEQYRLHVTHDHQSLISSHSSVVARLQSNIEQVTSKYEHELEALRHQLSSLQRVYDTSTERHIHDEHEWNRLRNDYHNQINDLKQQIANYTNTIHDLHQRLETEKARFAKLLAMRSFVARNVTATAVGSSSHGNSADAHAILPSDAYLVR